MLSWIAGMMIRRGVRRVNAGDVDLMLNSYAANAVSVFPGDHSWGGEYRGKDQIKMFLKRCVSAGLQFQIQDVVVSGWPWRAVIWIRLTDRANDADGRLVYSNRAVIHAQTRWGKIVHQETYEDTQKPVEFDHYLASLEHVTA